MKIIETCERFSVDPDAVAKRIRRAGRRYLERLDGTDLVPSKAILRNIVQAIVDLAPGNTPADAVAVQAAIIGSGATQVPGGNVPSPQADAVPSVATLATEEALGMSFSELSQSNQRIRIHSKVLGEDIWFVPLLKDVAEMHRRGMVAYTARELKELASKKKLTKKNLREIHAIKKHFGGEDGAIQEASWHKYGVRAGWGEFIKDHD